MKQKNVIASVAKQSIKIAASVYTLLAITLLLAVPTAPTYAQDITTGLIGHWTLNETTGTSATDSSSSGNNGTLSGTTFDASSTTGILGNALTFNGSSTYVATPLNTDFASGGFTISAWVKTSTNGNLRILSKFSSGSSQKWLMFLTGGQIEFGISGSGSGNVQSNGTYNDGQWHLVTGVADNANTMRLYIDGVLENTNTHDDSFTTNATSWRIGARNNNAEYFNGQIDDTRIYSRALTAVDVASLYANSGASLCDVSTSGTMIYNETYRVMQYCNGSNWVSMGKEASVLHGLKTRGEDYNINAVNFDGATSLGVTGLSEPEPSLVSGSFWVKRDTSNLGTSQTIAHFRNTAGEYLRLRFNTSDQIRIDGKETGVNIFKTLTGLNTAITDSNWHHIAFSVDSTNRSLDQMYIDDVSDVISSVDTFSAFGGGKEMYIGSFDGSSEALYGDVADLWLDFGRKLDFSIEANRRKFINIDGKAISLGANGSLPTGTAPDIFLSGDTASWHTNLGTIGGFTETGALTDATTLPPHEYRKELSTWLRLDETSGTTATDSSANGNNGTMTGGLSGTNTVAGPTGTALIFDGTDDNIILTDNLDIRTTDLSISLWIKSNCTTGQKQIMGNRRFNSASKGYDLRVDCTTGSIQAQINGSSSGALNTNTTAQNYLNDQWQHIVAVYDRDGDMSLYINNILDGNTDISSWNTTDILSSNSFTIGSTPDNNSFFNGSIDDIRIYNYALSPTEIAELYAASSIIFQPNAVTFDGTNDYLTSPPTGASDTKLWSSSLWFRRNTITDSRIFSGTNFRVGIRFTGNQLNILGNNPSGSNVLKATITSPEVLDNNWHHLMFSVDMTDTNKRHVFLDGVDLGSSIYTTYNNNNIEFTLTNLSIGAYTNGNDKFDGDLADVWIDWDTYIDLSVAANREKFISASGNPVNLGTTGDVPTGSDPDIFLSGNTANWHTNKGTGGGFTLNGALTDATTPAPYGKDPRYCSSPSLPEGTLIFNNDENVVQYCDGYRNIPLGPVGDGGGGCSSPSGSAGEMIYNADWATFQYCEGDEWIGVGSDPTASMLAQELVGHWKFDDGSGTTAIDSSGNGNNGTLTTMNPATDWISGVISGALDFNGATSRVAIGDPAGGNLDFGTGSFSFGVWVYPTGSNGMYDMPLYKGASSAPTAGYDIELGSSTWQAQIGDGVNNLGVTFSTTPILNQWSHLFVVVDRTNQEMYAYLDGNLVDTTNISSIGSVSTTSSLNIGSNNSGNNPFLGKIDDVRIYGRALPASEIQALYNAAN